MTRTPHHQIDYNRGDKRLRTASIRALFLYQSPYNSHALRLIVGEKRFSWI